LYFIRTITPPNLTPTPLPYTTLFRSMATRMITYPSIEQQLQRRGTATRFRRVAACHHTPQRTHRGVVTAGRRIRTAACGTTHARSEEHTSELQSRFDLVCRLLLEKKK